MTEWGDTIAHISANISLLILSISAFIGVFRLILGPTLPDRVAAVDLIALIATAIIMTYSISTDNPIFLDVAIALSLVIFISTVAFARYLEKGAQL